MNSKVEVSVPAESEEPHKTPRKRLKIEPENAQSEAEVSKPNRPDKYVRGRRGHLKLMTEMPLDTLHEIFRQLDPLDLLYLSWANKSLRGILMEKAAKYIWEEAYERLYESTNPPPRCPADVNFAQYTRFMYHKKCMVCNTRTGYYTSWMMRLRACKSCINSGLFSKSSHTDGLLTIRLTQRIRQKERYYPGPLIKGTQEFEAWERRCSNDRIEDLDRRKTERTAAILQKVKEMGRLKKRWDSFTAKFKEWDQTQALDSHFRPLPLDISVLYPFSTMIYLSDTENAEFEFDDIDRAAKEWIKWRDDFVFSFLPQGLQDRFETDKPLVQSLVIVYFSGRYLPDSLAQKCAKRDYDVSLPADKHGILQVIEQHAFFHAYPWKWSNKELTFDTKAFQIAVDILELLGMDPYATTLAQMKDLVSSGNILNHPELLAEAQPNYVALMIHPDYAYAARSL
ncbi:hypothetical protein AGABI1DRAFT_105520 [Agaricus bisporus var. burnettii JB137-S8]|uniref:F-box domain-containing protein n=1 Tax=Agaricus bisporus var. burnettii (strain JB137-S8 / ATCC MYA-4627 / FGSC 10392) TaxID=597362 RepID=K5XG48_AGABU|nr:uncharacterized protein AGABI1DRAFT_105520 [Agaricus bisporus var. burnettii JB137-S8]EKM82212.1 hypothetical protein AGABI1DRAFT_105520 [Agaricus bisporus var. burnettii JB137-S8]